MAQSTGSRRHPGVTLGAVSVLALALVLAGCVRTPPRNVNDACAIFFEYEDWYDAVSDASERWNVPPEVMLAIIHQESRFQGDIKPPRTRILWIIPGPRPSSAYGYAQATDGTWQRYRVATGNGGADRHDFHDAVDFVGWYVSENARRNGIPRSDAYRNYLAYHEGHGGYARGTYRSKPWLQNVARKVERRAAGYRSQLATCREELENRGPWWWPF